MKATYKPNQNLVIEFDFNDQKDLFGKMHMLQEILTENTCGKCGKHNIVFSVRTVDKYTYYELKCKDCGAVLQFGQTDDGLYPRRYEMDGTKPKLVDGKKVWLPNSGWIKFDTSTGEYK